jgi:hypothetical protein
MLLWLRRTERARIALGKAESRVGEGAKMFLMG